MSQDTNQEDTAAETQQPEVEVDEKLQAEVELDQAELAEEQAETQIEVKIEAKIEVKIEAVVKNQNESSLYSYCLAFSHDSSHRLCRCTTPDDRIIFNLLTSSWTDR